MYEKHLILLRQFALYVNIKQNVLDNIRLRNSSQKSFSKKTKMNFIKISKKFQTELFLTEFDQNYESSSNQNFWPTWLREFQLKTKKKFQSKKFTTENSSSKQISFNPKEFQSKFLTEFWICFLSMIFKRVNKGQGI